MKTKLLSILALLLMAVSGAWAQTTYSATMKEGTEDAANWTITPNANVNENDQVTIKYSGSKDVRSVKVKKAAATTPTVTFKANGKTKVVENVTLPHTFRCDYQSGDGELDLIIQELYELSGGGCDSWDPSSDNASVTCGIDDDDNQFITVNDYFDGTATVTGSYYDFNSDFFDYSLEITAPSNEVTVTPVDGNANEWTFQMPAYNVEVEVKYYDSILDFPLTLEAKTAGMIYVQYAKQGMQYRLNDGAKTLVDPNGEDWIEISLSEGDKVEFYGDGTKIDSYFGTQILAIDDNNTADVYIYGNIMSLVDEENYETATALGGRAFTDLFDGSTHLYSHPTKKLVLPATTLAYDCYGGMFNGCSSLATAPELPATTLADACYMGMFSGCSSLTTAPVLPAEKVEMNSYSFMFKGCTKLNSVTCLATDISGYNATDNWLNGVAPTGTFTKAAGMTGWSSGDSGIPSGWTVKDYGSVAKTLSEADDNSSWITANNGELADITLTRTLQTGGWNTFAVPFDAEIPTGWTVKELTGASMSGSKLTMTFGDATAIEAGKPYLVKVDAAVENPSFAGVTIKKDIPGVSYEAVDFIPTFGATTLTASKNEILFIGAGNKLYHPSADNQQMKGFRAYFQLKGDAVNARSFSIDFGEGEATAIEAVQEFKSSNVQEFNADNACNLGGQRVSEGYKGIVIVNGKKVIK